MHGVVIAHHPWGIEIEIDEVEAFGTVDLRFLSDDPADMRRERFPPLGTRLAARVQGTMPNGQLRLTARASDLGRPTGVMSE